MCSHYQAVTAQARLEKHFKTGLPSVSADQNAPTSSFNADLWPTYPAPIVWAQAGQRHCGLARWGLIAATAKALNLKLSTFNARSETAASSPTFGGAWGRGQRCIVPAEAVYEPDWRTGRHVPTRLQRADGAPMGLAGLWDSWRAPDGSAVLSFTLLTINAASHAVMQHLHKPQDEKRMVVVLPEASYDAWLNAEANPAAAEAAHLLLPYPAELLRDTGEPSRQIQDNPGLF